MACWLVAWVGGIDGGRLAAVVVLLPAAEGVGVGERSGVERFGCARARRVYLVEGGSTCT